MSTNFGYSLPQYSVGKSTNPAYRAASWGNAANYSRARQGAYGQFASQAQQADDRYGLAFDTFQNQRGMNSQRQRDQFLRFGVGALAGLMR